MLCVAKYLLIVFLSSVKAFDVQKFLSNNCVNDTNVRVNSQVTGEVGTFDTAFVCQHFRLTENDLDELISTDVKLSDETTVVFRFCEIGYFNENFLEKFPNILRIYFENCIISLKDGRRKDVKSPVKLTRIGIHDCLVFDNLRSRSFEELKLLTHFAARRTIFDYPEIDKFLFSKNELLYFALEETNVRFLSPFNIDRLLKYRLGGNKIKSLDNNFFQNNTDLTFVNFTDNALSEIPVFHSQHNLKDLHLAGLSLETIERTSFKNLISVETLNLSRNKNMTRILFETFKDMSNLKSLNLSKCHLNSLDYLGAENLESLDLSENNLKTVTSKTFENLTKLLQLKLNENKIISIEKDSFKDLLFLKELYIQNNEVFEIFENTFDNLKSLEILDLSFNFLRKIDEKELLNLHNLKSLHLQGNKIKMIPSSIFLPTSLTLLNISGNPLKLIGKNTFDNLVNLESLDLSKTFDNSYSVNLQCLKPLIKLEHLRLRGNKIESLAGFCIPNTVVNLDLSDNVLMEFRKMDFENLTNLKDLDLSDNFISELNEDVLDYLAVVSFVDLDGNPIKEGF